MITLFILFFIRLFKSKKAQFGDSGMEGLDAQLQSLVDNHKTPSVAYMLFDKDKIIHSFQSGFSDIQNQKPSSLDTVYSGFSVTKTFTALAILQLEEKRKLLIDDSVKKYLKDFPYSAEITIRQLLTHSSGLPNPIPLRWIHSPEEHTSFERDRFFSKILSKHNRLKSAPNEKFQYSNLGYVLLGQIIEQCSGLSYEDYIKTFIIHPIGIRENELGFQLDKTVYYAKGYQKNFSLMNFLLGFLMDKSKFVDRTEGKWVSFKEMMLNGPAHGGLFGTPNSFARYIQELLKPNSFLISDEKKELLFRENENNAGCKTGMCFSWFKGQLGSKVYFAHAGGGAGFYCEIRIYPEAGLGSVVMFNRSGMNDKRTLDQLDQYYFETEGV